MDFQALGQLPANGEHGIEGCARVLKDHPDLGSAHTSHSFIVEPQQVPALEAHLVGPDAAAVTGQQAEHGEHCGGLSAAAFAYQGKCLAPADGEAHVVDGMHEAPVGEELSMQAADLEQVAGCVVRKLGCHEEGPASSLERPPSFVMNPPWSGTANRLWTSRRRTQVPFSIESMQA